VHHFLELHVGGGLLVLAHVEWVELEVSWEPAAVFVDHLVHGHGGDHLEHADPQEQLLHGAVRQGEVVGTNRRHLHKAHVKNAEETVKVGEPPSSKWNYLTHVITTTKQLPSGIALTWWRPLGSG